jgi:hypothetical protein
MYMTMYTTSDCIVVVVCTGSRVAIIDLGMAESSSAIDKHLGQRPRTGRARLPKPSNGTQARMSLALHAVPAAGGAAAATDSGDGGDDDHHDHDHHDDDSDFGDALRTGSLSQVKLRHAPRTQMGGF